MVRHVDVAKVTMTGSSATAKLIQAAGADTLTPSIFELGGKSPNIVLDDADLDSAAVGLTLASVFGFNAGQACVAGSRMLVQRPVFEEVLERIEAIAKAIVVGDPADPATAMGPLISQKQYDKVVALHRGRPERDRAALRRSSRRRARSRAGRAGTGSSRRCSSPRTTLRGSAGRRSSVRSASSSRSTPTTRRSRWPTTAASASRPACGARTSPASTGSSARSSRATSG